MPELPEVETVRRGLEAAIAGRTITGVLQRRANLRRAFPVNFAARIEGRRILSIGRRAKYLQIHLEGSLILLVHLGMSGRFFVSDPRADHAAHDHLVFTLDNGKQLVFNDARRFGQVDLISEDEAAAYPSLRPLGPEPLDEEFIGRVLLAAMGKRHTSMKAALMDQRTVAGLGNIYVCEALYRSRIDPRRLADTLTAPEARKLVAAIKAVLTAAIKSGGSTLRDYVNSNRETGYFQHHFDVYSRAGKPCPHCKGAIARIVQGGRSTFYCPACQH